MQAVAETFNIKPNAANTRFYRLKQRMDPDAAGASSTPKIGGKRNAEESGVDDEEEKVEEKSLKKKKAIATGKGKGKGKKTDKAGKTEVKEEAVSETEVGDGEEGGEGDGAVFD